MYLLCRCNARPANCVQPRHARATNRRLTNPPYHAANRILLPVSSFSLLPSTGFSLLIDTPHSPANPRLPLPFFVLLSSSSLLTGVGASAAQNAPVTKTCLQCGAVLPSSVRTCSFCDSSLARGISAAGESIASSDLRDPQSSALNSAHEA